jgi:hypothetical protein
VSAVSVGVRFEWQSNRICAVSAVPKYSNGNCWRHSLIFFVIGNETSSKIFNFRSVSSPTILIRAGSLLIYMLHVLGSSPVVRASHCTESRSCSPAQRRGSLRQQTSALLQTEKSTELSLS